MKKFLIILVLAVVSCFAVHSHKTFALENQYDPLQRNLIVVEGKAELKVPVDSFRISFTFDAENNSFAKAWDKAKQAIDQMNQVLKELGVKKFEVIESWSAVGESKISFGSKGNKLANLIVIKVDEFPAGELHNLLSKLIDRILAINNDIALDNVDVDLTDEVEKTKKQEALGLATSNLDANAKTIAKASGKNILSPKRIFASSAERLQTEGIDDRENDYYDKAAFLSQGIAEQKISRDSHFRKGFKIKDKIVDHVYVSAQVSGVYEIN